MTLKTERNHDSPLIRFAIAIVFGAIGFSLKFIFKPVVRGFSCGDLSINLPSIAKETVPLKYFYLIAIPFTFLVVTIGEMCLHMDPDERLCFKSACQWNFDRRLCQMARFISIWLLGIAVDLFCVNLVKLSVGGLRPDFIEQCYPTDLKYRNGVDGCRTNNDSTHFFYLYTCQRLDDNNAKILDSRRSFYSGHASTAFFFATFLIIYVHCRILPCFRRLFITDLFVVLYVLLFGAASFVAISRLFDHKHHNVDVVCGALAGKAIALFLTFIHKEHFSAVRPISRADSSAASVANGASQSSASSSN
ncbi:hypothetical protein niasHS_006504 [Heterodera schachtii]|uniref:Phosphatidic acid phosphatase type 2/haloperoxidase domain-containing protein n=1 Tax=Heterodera schachtii TaxID=97005 RepID=A0ABD2JHQ5_HETSC